MCPKPYDLKYLPPTPKCNNTSSSPLTHQKHPLLNNQYSIVHLLPLLTSLFLLLIPTLLFAQSRQQLEKDRNKLLKEIRLTNKLLQNTTKNKETELNRYTTLQKQIKKREQLLSTLTEEINLNEERSKRTGDVIEALHRDIKQLKEEYATLAQQAFRQKMSNSTLLFLFSANGLNDGFRRWQYIKQYDAYRKKQAILIADTQNRLQKRNRALILQLEEKETLLCEQEDQIALMAIEMKTRNQLYKTLRKDEKRLKNTLAQQRKAEEKLNKAIENIILAEIERTSKPVTPEKNTNTTPKINSRRTIDSNTENFWTSEFQRLKGQHKWPVKSGVITKYFGKQAHPTIKNIQITNNGIDIQTDKGEEARAIQEGRVAGVQFIPGYAHTLILKHGDYFTVYSNLEEVYFKKGDIVKRLQNIGRINTNKTTNTAILHFEVWQDKTRLNPLHWVKR